MSDFLCFISHASEDNDRAIAVLDEMERHGVKCWIAPRDISPGGSYPVEIESAIQRSGALVLLLSSRANSSAHVFREVELALQRGVLIYPVRLEPVLPERGLGYLIGVCQWIDAFRDSGDKALRDQISMLAKRMMDISRGQTPVAVSSVRPPVKAQKKCKWIAGGALLVLSIGIFFAVHIFRNLDRQEEGKDSNGEKWQAEGGLKDLDLRLSTDFDLRLSIQGNHEVYRDGETVQFILESSVDCYAALIVVTEQGDEALLFPNTYHPDGFIRGGGSVVIPPETSGPGSIHVKAPFGTDQVFAVAFTDKPTMDGFTRNIPPAYDAGPLPLERGTLRGLGVTLDAKPPGIKKSWASVTLRTAPAERLE